MERSLVLGVEAGSAYAKAVLAELTEGKPRIVGAGKAVCTGVRRGLVVDLDAAADALTQAASQACEAAGHKDVTRAVVSISGAHVQSVVGTAAVSVSRPSRGVTPEDVRRALDTAAGVPLPEGRELLHVLPRAYRLDGESGVGDPLGLSGRLLQAEAHLITADGSAVQNSLRAAAQAGFQVADYQLAIRAAGEAVLTQEEREAGVLLLDVGAGTTGVAVYERGNLWHVSVIPIGSEHITSDLATLLRIPLAVAEELKVTRGWAASDLCPDTRFELVSPSGRRVREVEDRQLAAIIEPRIGEVLSLAAEQVKRSGYGGHFPAGLVLTGGGSRLQGLEAVSADCLGLKSRLGTAGEEGLAGEPDMATAAGLVRWGAKLYEDEAAVTAVMHEQAKWGRWKQWLFGLFQ